MLYVLVVLDEDQVFVNDTPKGEEMVVFSEADDWSDDFLRQFIELKLFDITFFVLHPKDSFSIEVEGHV